MDKKKHEAKPGKHVDARRSGGSFEGAQKFAGKNGVDEGAGIHLTKWEPKPEPKFPNHSGQPRRGAS